ncbi:MAG: S8 family serine peptidase [Deltaproteobacteria bacterium]|nr:S8 family serine peptidase [Deltaproteobacteria bacterium]
MKKTTAILLLFLFFATRFANADTQNPLIKISTSSISIRALHIPLQDILKIIAKSGINISVDPELNPEVTASFSNRNIREGLDSILGSLNHVLIWDHLDIAGQNNYRLVGIEIFRPGQKDRMLRLDGRQSLKIVKNPRDGSFYVAHEILLRIGPDIDPSSLIEFVDNAGGVIISRYPALGIYRVRLPDNIDIPSISEKINGMSTGITSEPNLAWPVSLPHRMSGDAELPMESKAFSQDEGSARVAVLDTGMETGFVPDGTVVASFDAVNPEQTISDNLGHGTQMALIASGAVAPEGREQSTKNPVISIRAFDDNGFTSSYTIMEAIDFAEKNGARVMSLSWGSETKSAFMEDAINTAVIKGMVVVAAAGNEPTGKPEYPAAYPRVIGVGALSPDGKTWNKSNYGSFVDIYAPGFATLPVGYKGAPGVYAGTSISTAFVASRIADFISTHPDATSKQIIEALKKPFMMTNHHVINK